MFQVSKARLRGYNTWIQSEAVSPSKSRIKQGSSRRGFLAASAAIAVALPLPAAGFSFFAADEAKLAEAVCEVILPSDDLPGAKEAGAVNYIDKQLSGTLKKFAPAYRQGLSGLQKAGFLALSQDERSALLDRAIDGKVAGVQASFVRMMIDHTMQGTFSDPKHGGNRERTGWKLIGYGGHSH